MKNFFNYIDDINTFFRNNGVQIDPIPEVKIDKTPCSRFDTNIKTGFYDPNSNSITLFIDNRHVKDILRSYCHELIHHNQHLSNPTEFESANISGTISENSELEKIEADAYMRGNLMFRKWTGK